MKAAKARHELLLVDNNPVFLRLLTPVLEEAGYRVRTADSGLAAMELLEQHRPAAILVDLVMPHIGGDQLCRILRARPEFRETPLIILSAIASEEEIDVAAMGADACIAKGPIQEMRRHILASLQRLIGGSPSGRPRTLGRRSKARREITRELLALRDHYQTILANLTEAVLEFRQPDQRVTYANQAAMELFARPEAQLLGAPFATLFDPADRERLAAMLAVAGRSPQHTEDDFPLPLGKRQLSLSLLPINGQDGEGGHLLAIARDITERKKAEAALLSSHAELEQIFNTAADGMVVIDREFTVLRLNATAGHQFGFAGPATGRKCYDLFPGERCHTVKCPMIRILEGEERVEFEEEKVGDGDRLLPFLVTATPYRSPGGELLGIVENFKDISERKHWERALLESEERYRDLFENASDLIQSVLPDGRFLYVNRAWRETLGYSPEEVRELTIMEVVHPDHRQDCETLFRRLVTEGRPLELETALVTKDGRKVLVSGHTSCKFSQGRALYTRGMFRDITAWKQAEAERNRLIAELTEMQEALRIQSIRDPLTSLYNRRFLEESLAKEIGRARRHGTPLAVFMLDLDHFKRLNDTLGHQAGDQVLRELGGLLRRHTRQEDIACRYGGEEFVVLLPGISLADARRRAGELRHLVARQGRDAGQRAGRRTEGEAGSFPVTVSIGVAGLRGEMDGQTLLAAADRALYRAKQQGRDRVVVADAEGGPGGEDEGEGG